MEEQTNQEQNSPEIGEDNSMHTPEPVAPDAHTSVSNKKNTLIIIALGVVLGVLLVLSAYLFFSKETRQSQGADREPDAISSEALLGASNNEIATKLETIDELTAQRNFDAAIALAEATLPEIDDINDKASIQREIALNRLNKGIGIGDKKDIFAGMDILKRDMNNPEISDKERAWTASRLRTFYCISGRDPEVVEMMFSGEGAQSQFAGFDEDEALHEFIKWIYDLHPDSWNTLRLGGWPSKQLIDNSESLNDEERTELEQQIINALSEADSKFTASGKDIRAVASYHFWRGVFYGTLLAAGNEENKDLYRDGFEAEFNILFDLERFQPEGNSRLEEIMPFAHFYYAGFLNRIYGSERKADIDMHMNKLLAYLDSVDDADLNEFIAHLRVEGSRDPEDSKVIENDYVSDFSVELAAKYPGYKEVMATYGWVTE